MQLWYMTCLTDTRERKHVCYRTRKDVDVVSNVILYGVYVELLVLLLRHSRGSPTHSHTYVVIIKYQIFIIYDIKRGVHS